MKTVQKSSFTGPNEIRFILGPKTLIFAPSAAVSTLGIVIGYRKKDQKKNKERENDKKKKKKNEGKTATKLYSRFKILLFIFKNHNY